MDSKDASTSTENSLPFGAIRDGEQAVPAKKGSRPRKKRRSTTRKPNEPNEEGGSDTPEDSSESRAPRKRPAKKRASDAGSPEAGTAEQERGAAAPGKDSKQGGPRRDGEAGRRGGRRRRGRRGRGSRPDGGKGRQDSGASGGKAEQGTRKETKREAPREIAGLFVSEKGGFGLLRSDEANWLPSKSDVFVPRHLTQKFKLRDGAYVEGRITKGQKHKWQLLDIKQIDGRDPEELKDLVAFKNLTSIDPDFHYAVGDGMDDLSMRIVDILCPIGRGQRGLIVAPPRTGKTTLMRQFAAGVEKLYPDVHLMVVLVDERPEEATEWQRSLQRGRVFVSTADETAKHHIHVAEAAWLRAMRLVELGEDVIILLDSITRLARAYNNQMGGGGKTMSGGLDSRAMERPRKFFGSARNTESAGSLTIVGTTLIETGSRLDQLVFEEFKGTGNMEMVLARRLADRRIFPALDIERSGTRKEEKLVGTKRLKRIHTLRRVLARMNFVEAMELLITKLDDVEKTDDFLQRFDVDPEL